MTIQSPEHPDESSNNVNCIWRINVPMAKQIKLYFENFDTQPGVDYLEIIDGSSSMNKILLARLSGKSMPEEIVSSGSELTLSYSMATSTAHPGFKIRYEGIVLSQK